MTKSTDGAFVAQFVRWAEHRNFSYVDHSIKARLHREAKSVLRIVAKQLALNPGDYEIRSNLGGIAVSGEITLHSSTLYIQLSDSALFSGLQILFRRCKNMKDYCGEQNHFLPLSALFDIQAFVEKLKRL